MKPLDWMYQVGRTGRFNITHFGGTSDNRCRTLDGAIEVVSEIIGCRRKDIILRKADDIPRPHHSTGYFVKARKFHNVQSHIGTSTMEIVRTTARANATCTPYWKIMDYQYQNNMMKFMDTTSLHHVVDWFSNYFHYKHKVISILNRYERMSMGLNIVELVVGVEDHFDGDRYTKPFDMMVCSNVICARRDGKWFCYLRKRDGEVAPERVIFIEGPGIYERKYENDFNNMYFSSNFPIWRLTKYGLHPRVAHEPGRYDLPSQEQNVNRDGHLMPNRDALRNAFTNAFNGIPVIEDIGRVLGITNNPFDNTNSTTTDCMYNYSTTTTGGDSYDGRHRH